MSELSIKSSDRVEKLEETHFEMFQRLIKRKFGINIPGDLFPLAKMCESDDIPDNIMDTYLTERMKVAKMMAYHRDPAMVSEYRALRSCFAHTLAFSRHKRVFMVERGLQQKLLHTNVEKVDAQFIRSPFFSMYVTLPHNEELLIPNNITGEHLVKGFYVMAHDVDGDEINLLQKGGTFIKASERHGSKDLYILKVLAIGDSKGGNKGDDALYYTTIIVKPGEDIMTQMDEQLNYYIANMEEKPYVEAFLKFIMNLMLYISSPSAVLESVAAKYLQIDKKASDKERAKADAKNEGISKISAISVGKGIPGFNSMDGYYGDTAIKNRVIGCPRWLVRGHWRAQAYGVGRSQHRPKWIEPYEKGPGITSDILESRDYIVG